jgi:hypothetical protein
MKTKERGTRLNGRSLTIKVRKFNVRANRQAWILFMREILGRSQEKPGCRQLG